MKINKKASAIWQVFTLVTMIFAFAFMIGSSIEEVSAATCAEVSGNSATCVSENLIDSGEMTCTKYFMESGLCSSGEICCQGAAQNLPASNSQGTSCSGQCFIPSLYECTGTVSSGLCTAPGTQCCPIPFDISAKAPQQASTENTQAAAAATPTPGQEVQIVVNTIGAIGGGATAVQQIVSLIKGKGGQATTEQVTQILTERGFLNSAGELTEAGSTLIKSGGTLGELIGPPTLEQMGLGNLGLEGEPIYGTMNLGPTTQAGSWVGRTFLKGSWNIGDYFFGGQTNAGAHWWSSGGGVSGAGQIVYTAAVAFAVKSAIVLIFQAFGTNIRNLNNIKDAGTIAVIGTTAWATIAVIAGASGPAGWVVGAAVAIIMLGVALFMGQQFAVEVFNYQVQVWQPQTGGENCESCNDLRYGCSEYQCKSMGKACELENKGTKYETCIWVNENDMEPPKMSAMESVLKSGYVYKNINAIFLGTGDVGVNIEYTSDSKGCIPPFTSVTLGVNTDEPAECKLDIDRPSSYEEAKMYFSEGAVLTENHTILIPGAGLPGPEAIVAAGWQLENSGSYTFYVRCEDANGQSTDANFAMHFCIQDGPDMQAPIIEGTNYLSTGEYTSGSYVAYNQTTANLEVYTNEPANCRWDFEDKEYNSMMNNMTGCSQGISQYLYSNTYTYGCRDTLTGVEAGETNKYYIRCQDKPWLHNQTISGQTAIANKESHVLTLKGTYPLQIDELTVNGLENNSKISDKITPTKVELIAKTSAGADEGNAMCKYSLNGGLFYDFATNINGGYFSTNNVNLWLVDGLHNILVKCYDEGGNVATDLISFEVDLDTSAPTVARLYYEENKLKLITDEEAECVYSLSDCNYAFEDGIEISTFDNIEHFVQWNTDLNLYIKCVDEFGNKPIPQNSCSIVARAFE